MDLTMKLHVGSDIIVRAAADCPIVAMLRPASGLAQWLSSETYAFDPWVPTTEYVDVYGNLCQRMVVPQGEMRLRVEATVETEPSSPSSPARRSRSSQDLPDSALQYLLPSRYCPSDRLEAAGAGRSSAPPRPATARSRRSAPGSSETSTTATAPATPRPMRSATLERGAGVCRDFAHVGIALTRALRIPARMVVGYLLGLEPMDLHAWFEAYVGGRWYTFDATQAAARGGRVVLAYGRDAADVAFISNYGPLRRSRCRSGSRSRRRRGRCRRRRRRSPDPERSPRLPPAILRSSRRGSLLPELEIPSKRRFEREALTGEVRASSISIKGCRTENLDRDPVALYDAFDRAHNKEDTSPRAGRRAFTVCGWSRCPRFRPAEPMDGSEELEAPFNAQRFLGILEEVDILCRSHASVEPVVRVGSTSSGCRRYPE